MEDQFAAPHRGVDALVTLNVPFDEFDLVEDLGKVVAATGREVVEHTDLMALLKEPSDQVGPDEPTPAGDQDVGSRH
jgi:hypothetical protein